MVEAFPINEIKNIREGDLGTYDTDEDIVKISDGFAFAFENAGYMHEGHIYTCDVSELEEEPICLRDVLQQDVEEMKAGKRLPRGAGTVRVPEREKEQKQNVTGREMRAMI